MSPAPPLSPLPPDHDDEDGNDAILPLLFAESPREHACLLESSFSSSSSSSHQYEQESHLIEVSPSLRLHITLAEDTGRNGSLFAFSVWNGGVMLARHLHNHPSLVQGKRVVEFGAAGALPSLMALAHDSKFVMITDYPDERLLQAIRTSVGDVRNAPWLGLKDKGGSGGGRRVEVQGHMWGSEVGGLLMAGGPSSTVDSRRHTGKEGGEEGAESGEEGKGEVEEEGQSPYDVALVGECLWLHDQHESLLNSIFLTLRPGGMALVCFAHHVPGCEEKDLGFFAMAAQRRRYAGWEGEEEEGWFEVRKVGEERMGHMYREGETVTQFLYVMEKRSKRVEQKEEEEEVVVVEPMKEKLDRTGKE